MAALGALTLDVVLGIIWFIPLNAAFTFRKFSLISCFNASWQKHNMRVASINELFVDDSQTASKMKISETGSRAAWKVSEAMMSLAARAMVSTSQ